MKEKSSFLIVLLAACLPGAGQFIAGRRRRGIAVLLSTGVILAFAWRQNSTIILACAVAVWLWSVWDFFCIRRRRRAGVAFPSFAVLIAVCAAAIMATNFQPAKLISGFSSVRPILSALLSPDIAARPTLDRIGTVPILVPCVSPLPRPEVQGSREAVLLTSRTCASVGETIAVKGIGFFPNFTGELWWRDPIGDLQRLSVGGKPQTFTTNEEGRFAAQVQVPPAMPSNVQLRPGQTQTHQIEARQQKAYGGLRPSGTFRLIMSKMGETLGLAFLATVLAAVLAMPVGFLGARNLMGNRLMLPVYYAVRTVLNIVRSIETLIWAIIFGVWVGLGPFAGMLALLFHSIAALGKLFSEAVESIDPRPVEAIRAAGGNELQVAVFGVIPQITASFLSFALYRWDINVRMATVIGLVCDAGIGFLVIQWIRLGNYNAMASTIIVIALVIAALDYLSSALRRRLLESRAVKKSSRTLGSRAFRIAGIACLALFFVWSWRAADLNLSYLVRDADKGVQLARELLAANFFSQSTHPRSIRMAVRTGSSCAAESSKSADGTVKMRVSPACADVGRTIAISGEGLPANSRVFIRWRFPDGGELRVKENCCMTDAGGRVKLEARVHPLADAKLYDGKPASVSIDWNEATGGWRLSDASVTTAKLILITILMAFLATTLGTLIAAPLSFAAARNTMGGGRISTAVYFGMRGLFNLTRSIEPMILALIFAAWVGLGPFAGILALTFNNIPNLAKLFSEAIEEIDKGQVEAVTATGAGRLQVIRYAFIPQLIPKFTAFILYQWDINIRMSTVIGFVGGGGIGQQWRVWFQLNQYASAAVATWAIVAVVWLMDYASSRVRSRLV